MSTQKTILINGTLRQLRVATLQGNELTDFSVEFSDSPTTLKGNIYVGRVDKIVPSIEAAFVIYSDNQHHGFLPFAEIHEDYLKPEEEGKEPGSTPIHERLREGQTILVQVDKEERGSKGAALTTYVSLAGSYTVIMPNKASAGGISKSIDGEARETIKAMLETLNTDQSYGVIIRTAAQKRSIDELKADLNGLTEQWKVIEARIKDAQAPALVHREIAGLKKIIRDRLKHDVTEIVIDTPRMHQEVTEYLKENRPEFVDKVVDYSQQSTQVPLFTHYQIESTIENLFVELVHLPSGGSCVFNPTEALTAIDVNSAKAKGDNTEGTALMTNLEAAKEIAKQLVLRDIGGLVVIDFIDMKEEQNIRKVEETMHQCMKGDTARIHIGTISEFGLLELSRQRKRPSVNDHHLIACPRCHGRGSVRTIESFSNSLLHVIEQHATHGQQNKIRVQACVPTDVASYLFNQRRDEILEIENRQGTRIEIVPELTYTLPKYQIKRVRETQAESDGLDAGYQVRGSMVKEMQQNTQRIRAQEPATRTQRPTRTQNNDSKPGLLKRLLQAMMGEPQKPSTRTQRSPNQRNRNRSNNRRSAGGNTRRGPQNRSGGQRSGNNNRRRTSSGNNNTRRNTQAQNKSGDNS